MKRAVAALTLALTAGALFAQAAPPADRKAALEALAATERAFSKMSEEKGIKDSFLAYIADDGIIFRPGPVRGKDFLAPRPPARAKLVWRPIEVDLSAAGDLGYTTGPYQVWPPGAPADAKPGTGYFVTLWKRQADGNFKFVLDLGTGDNPLPAKGEADYAAPAATAKVALAKPAGDPAAGREALLAADRKLATAETAAYLAAFAGDGRALRMEQPLAVGHAEVAKALATVKTADWKPSQAGIADSGDLGYTYGTVSLLGAGAAGAVGTGDYLKIWKKDAAGAWKIVVDVVAPRPGPPPPPPPAPAAKPS
jgi:ketosteroid isomerase-like protein